MTQEKKSERMEIRLGYHEKQGFVEACEIQGDTPSGALRRFISGYTRRADGDVMGEANRRLIRRYGLGAALIGLFGVGIGAIAMSGMFSPSPPTMSDAEIFSLRDQNSDGELDALEQGFPLNPDGSPFGILRVLDLDGSGTLSASEFRAKGKMVYAIEDADDKIIGAEGEAVPMTMVEFEIGPDRVRSGSYDGAVINAGDLDRLVVWYADGTNAVFEGRISIANNPDGLEVNADTVTFPASVKIDEAKDGSVTASRGGGADD